MTGPTNEYERISPTRLRRLWLLQHARCNPTHEFVGWSGEPLTCGTCMGIPADVIRRGAHSRWPMPTRWVRCTHALPPEQEA